MRVLVASLALAAVGRGASLPSVDIDTSSITVSGLSAGAFQAVQMSVAYSSVFQGVGVVAGGPFWCAQDDVDVALSSCMKDPSLISVSELVTVTGNTAATGFVDPLEHLKGTRVYVFSGTKDTIVARGVVESTRDYYASFVASSDIKAKFDIPSEHSMVTQHYGSKCSYLGEPFINNCGFDLVGDLLQWLFQGKLTAPAAGASGQGEYVEFSQSDYLPPDWLANAAGLAPTGIVYVPPQCRGAARSCRLHVAYHGCKQTLSDVQDKYYKHAGYDTWADANGIVVLYPQAAANSLNPHGCFDWWGYTGSDYASNAGVQMVTVKKVMDALAGTTLGAGTQPKPGSNPWSNSTTTAAATAAMATA